MKRTGYGGGAMWEMKWDWMTVSIIAFMTVGFIFMAVGWASVPFISTAFTVPLPGFIPSSGRVWVEEVGGNTLMAVDSIESVWVQNGQLRTGFRSGLVLDSENLTNSFPEFREMLEARGDVIYGIPLRQEKITVPDPGISNGAPWSEQPVSLEVE